jgi:hypothetical protein
MTPTTVATCISAGAQLAELAASAQAGQRQRRVLPGDDHQMQGRRQVLQQKGQGLVHRLAVDGVVVVQRQDQATWQRRELVQHDGQDRIGRRRLRGLQRGQRALAHAGDNRLQRGDQIGKKANGVAVPFVQRQPGDPRLWRLIQEKRGSRQGCEPCADQGGFAGAGRG